MTLKINKKKSFYFALAISLTLVVTLVTALICVSPSNFFINNSAIIKQVSKQTLLPANVTGAETSSSNTTYSDSNLSTSISSNSISPISLNSTVYSQQDLTYAFYAPLFEVNQGQIAGSGGSVQSDGTDSNPTDSLNNSGTFINANPMLLNASDFVTYTYGGYPVQQLNSTQFNFTFPDNIPLGQIAGSDALTVSNFSIQKLDFDAMFVTPKINATGFDEMAIFATSDTATYKGTEFGVRMDLMNGSIYGYIQEPSGSYGGVNFIMLQLMANDGAMHHYSLVMSNVGVSYYVDGVNYGYLIFPSNTNYSSLSFSVCATVHRFTDDWNSSGDGMIAGNFFLNQQ